jgi:TatA/E family protein of Tat protein translocase
MKKNLIQISLVTGICAFTLVFPAYLRCSNLAGAKLLSTDLSFENPDQEDVFSRQQNESKPFVSIALIIFGAGKLPQVGENMGKAIRNFKSATERED